MDGNDVYKINFELPYNFNCDIQQTEVNWILFKVFPLGDADQNDRDNKVSKW